MALPNPGMDAVPFTPLTAEFLDDMIENIESLSDGTGFENGAITTNTLADNAVTSRKVNSSTFPKFSVYRNSALTYTSGANTKLVFDATLWDTHSSFSAGTYTIPAGFDGYWHIDARMSVTTSSVVSFIMLYKNGVQYKRGGLAKANAEYQGNVLSVDVMVNAGDTLDIYYFVAGSINAEVGAPHTFFSGRYLP